MSCAELMPYHQNLTAGFPYTGHQRSVTDTYYSNYNPASGSAACAGDYNGQVEAVDARMLQSLAGETSIVPSAVSSGDFTSSSSLLLGPSSATASSPPQHLRSGDSRLAASSLPLSPPCAPQPRPTANITGAATPSSSSPSSSSPLLASASTLSPSLSYFPPSSSAFSSRPPTHGCSGTFPHGPSSFLPSTSSSSSTLSASSYPLKRTSSDIEDPDDATVPKKTRYVTSNCVVLTYHDKETSSEVDDHFSKALSSSSSPCNYGTGTSTRHSSTDSPPMSQRNFPPSFWDAMHHHHQHPYNYQQAFSGSPTQGGFLGTPHDPLYPLPAPFLSGSLATPALHHPLSSLHKDPWAGFPFVSAASKSTLNYYPYPRAVTYPDPLSASYGSGGNSSRLSSSYSSLLLPTSSVRSGHFPSATITSAQCASGDLGSRVTSFMGDHPRNPFGSGSVPGPDSSAQEAGKDFHWF